METRREGRMPNADIHAMHACTQGRNRKGLSDVQWEREGETNYQGVTCAGRQSKHNHSISEGSERDSMMQREKGCEQCSGQSKQTLIWYTWRSREEQPQRDEKKDSLIGDESHIGYDQNRPRNPWPKRSWWCPAKGGGPPIRGPPPNRGPQQQQQRAARIPPRHRPPRQSSSLTERQHQADIQHTETSNQEKKRKKARAKRNKEKVIEQKQRYFTLLFTSLTPHKGIHDKQKQKKTEEQKPTYAVRVGGGWETGTTETVFIG